MNVETSPKRIFATLLLIILALLFANGLGLVAKLYFGHGTIYGLVPLFDFNREMNVPTLFSSFALLFASMLLSVIASNHKSKGSSWFPWAGLAGIFLFLSIDEVSSIHELFTAPVRESLNTSGLLFYAWVIPYGIALAAFVICYLPFLAKLPKNIMILFIISGATFVAGAIGFELLGGRHDDLHGQDNLVYCIFYTCEEFLEMLGSVLFIYTLLLYIVSQFKFLTITVSEKSS